MYIFPFKVCIYDYIRLYCSVFLDWSVLNPNSLPIYTNCALCALLFATKAAQIDPASLPVHSGGTIVLLLLYMEGVVWRTDKMYPVANIVWAHESKRMSFIGSCNKGTWIDLMQFPRCIYDTDDLVWRIRKKKKERKRSSLTGLGHQVMWTLPKSWPSSDVQWCTACYGAIISNILQPPIIPSSATSHPCAATWRNHI